MAKRKHVFKENYKGISYEVIFDQEEFDVHGSNNYYVEFYEDDEISMLDESTIICDSEQDCISNARRFIDGYLYKRPPVVDLTPFDGMEWDWEDDSIYIHVRFQDEPILLNPADLIADLNATREELKRSVESLHSLCDEVYKVINTTELAPSPLGSQWNKSRKLVTELEAK